MTAIAQPRGPSGCVCAGQPLVGTQADVAGWGERDAVRVRVEVASDKAKMTATEGVRAAHAPAATP